MKKILVTLDFKGNDNQLIEAAKDWGRAFDAEILLLNVDPIEIDEKAIKDSPIMMHHAYTIESLVEDSIQDVEGKLGGEIFKFRHILKTGNPQEQILKVAKKEKVDLIIMGNNKHSATYRFLIGSVGDHIVRKSNVPMLLIPNE